MSSKRERDQKGDVWKNLNSFKEGDAIFSGDHQERVQDRERFNKDQRPFKVTFVKIIQEWTA